MELIFAVIILVLLLIFEDCRARGQVRLNFNMKIAIIFLFWVNVLGGIANAAALLAFGETLSLVAVCTNAIVVWVLWWGLKTWDSLEENRP